MIEYGQPSLALQHDAHRMLTVGYGCSPTGLTATEARQIGKKRELGMAYGMGKWKAKVFGGKLVENLVQGMDYAGIEKNILAQLVSGKTNLEWETCLDE